MKPKRYNVFVFKDIKKLDDQVSIESEVEIRIPDTKKGNRIIEKIRSGEMTIADVWGAYPNEI